jgi:hypothetical protein
MPQKYSSSQNTISELFAKKKIISMLFEHKNHHGSNEQTYGYTISKVCSSPSDSQILSLRGDSQVKSIEQD